MYWINFRTKNKFWLEKNEFLSFKNYSLQCQTILQKKRLFKFYWTHIFCCCSDIFKKRIFKKLWVIICKNSLIWFYSKIIQILAKITFGSKILKKWAPNFTVFQVNENLVLFKFLAKNIFGSKLLNKWASKFT